MQFLRACGTAQVTEMVIAKHLNDRELVIMVHPDCSQKSAAAERWYKADFSGAGSLGP